MQRKQNITVSDRTARIHINQEVLPMSDDLRISVDDLRKRMKAGEDFIMLDVRNPTAWAESDVMIPNARRVPLDDFESHLYEIPNKPIVAYCT